MAAILEVSGLKKAYKNFELKNVSFSIHEDCITGFIGVNGAGKTTTINALLNLIHRDGGIVKFRGKDISTDEKTFKDKIGVVFDSGCFYDELTIKDMTVAFNLAISEKENQYPKATALLSSTPYTKGKVIVSKYALYFIIYVICCIAYLVEMQFVPELKLDNFAQTAALVFLIQAFGMGIFLPIQYKFGYEKTKFVCFLLFLSPVIIDITKGISVPSKLALFMQLNPVVLAVVYSGVGICIWFISFALSKRIFNKKDLI